jgi:glycosyltransferase involved in cell wall biosynthesis
MPYRPPELEAAGERARHDAGDRSAPRAQAVRAMAGRLSWGLADQAISSLTNFVVGVFVARSLGLTAFGMFTLAWATYGVVLNLSRGMATDPLVVRFSGVAVQSWRDAVARSSGTALAVGAATGASSVLTGIALGGSLGATFVALGVVLPGLLLQDAWRFAFFAAGKGNKAFANDVVWAAALAPALIVGARHGTVVAFVLAWGLSGAVAAGYGCLQTGILPSLAGMRRWLRQQRDLGPRYLVENVSNSGAGPLRLYGLGAIAGLADVGAVRGAVLLLGPFMAVLMGLSLVNVAEAARVLRRAPHRLRRFCLLLGGGQAVAAMGWGLVLLLVVPDRLGEVVLGSVWLPASALIVPVTVEIMGAAAGTGAAAGLRALGAARRSMRAQLVASAAYVTGGLVGAAVNGALGSSWGVGTASVVGATVWWIQLHAALRERASRSAADPDPENEGRPRDEGAVSGAPRLSIGLPVYNGEQYLAEALDALLGQSYRDFELIISDNASTDDTERICRSYLARDSRIRYIRQPRNLGCAGNHNFVFEQARGELFKWASHDDLYGRDLVLRCIETLDAHPDVVLCHAWLATIDGAGDIVEPFDYRLATDSPHTPRRFKSLLFDSGGDDFYGVIRTDVLRRVAPHASYHHADRTIVAEIALHGPFLQVPELLYLRRDHPDRAERANPTIRSRCVNLDPRRVGHSSARLLTEYVLGFIGVIRRSPLSPAERRRCYWYLCQWLADRAVHEPAELLRRRSGRSRSRISSAVAADTVVAGCEGRTP